MTRRRARELGIEIGLLPTGPANAITDVPGVRVGHATVWRDEPDPPVGRGVARTGVTAILPTDPLELLGAPVPCGVAVLNGAGELTSTVQVREWGALETPILLTSTMQVGRAYDAMVQLLCDLDPTLGDGSGRDPDGRRVRRLVAERRPPGADHERGRPPRGATEPARASRRGRSAPGPA